MKSLMAGIFFATLCLPHPAFSQADLLGPLGQGGIEKGREFLDSVPEKLDELMGEAAKGRVFANEDECREVPNPFGGVTVRSDEEGRSVVAGLLENVYRAFDRRDEGLIYDTLSRSAHGDLLADIYLETRRALEIRNQGGARARVTGVEMVGMDREDLADGEGFRTECVWNVSGSVGHCGHLHERRNQYEAVLTVQPVEGVWKITGLELLSEKRL